MLKSMSDRNSSTVDKALGLLDLFSETRTSFGLSEAARLIGRDKATVQRHLTDLQRRGFLDQDPMTRAYFLGPAVTRLALVRDRTFPVETGVRKVMQKLVIECGETCHVSHLQDRGLSTIAIEETHFKGTRVYIDPAQLLPMHASATGIAVLSAMPADRRKAALAEDLEQFTPKTPVSVDQINGLAQDAVRRGYSKMSGTFEADVVGIGAPVFDVNNNVCGAIAIASPTSRFNDDVESRNSALLIEAAQAISRLYGAIQSPSFGTAAE